MPAASAFSRKCGAEGARRRGRSTELGVAMMMVMKALTCVADRHREQSDQPAGDSRVEQPGQYVPDTAENQVFMRHDG